MTVFSSPDDFDPVTMTETLRRAGAIAHARVTRVDYAAIGEGLIGDTVRFQLDYDRAEPGAPMTIAGKFPAADPAARATGASLGLYLNEVRFYQRVLPTITIAAPRCYHAEIDDDGAAFALLLEDAAPARAADQIVGCSRGDAGHVLRQVAALHAPTFGDAALWDVPCMSLRERSNAAALPNLRDYAARFRQRYGAMMEPDELVLVDAFVEVAEPLIMRRPKRFSMIHADLRLDNMLFDAKGGAVPVMLLDWQCVSPGSPCYDVAYFLQTSYPADRLVEDEPALLAFYVQALADSGLTEMNEDDVWHDYRAACWAGLMTALVASDVAKRTPQGDRVFTRMARGSITQMRRHRTLKLATD